MPKNNNLEPVKLPMAIRFGEKPVTRFKNNLDSINIELMQAPTMDNLRGYLPQFAHATWSETPWSMDNLSLKEKDDIIRDAFFGRCLPTALETIELVFRISGISLQEVTHILRYRTASFSADCSGDKWWTLKDALVPNSIQNSNGDKDNDDIDSINKYKNQYIADDDFYGRYKKIVELSKELYCDMIDSKKISIMDARYILPRCLETFYYMKISLKDAINFIRQRIDKQIQPETDNVMAYFMYLRILEQYPIVNGLIDIHAPSQFYIKTARTGRATNLYFPDKDSDRFEWNENDFIYQCERSQMNGTDVNEQSYFNKVLNDFEHAISRMERVNMAKLNLDYYEEEHANEIK